MSGAPVPADIRRWSEEVARDPRSLAFLPLAEFYYRSGHAAAARRLCLRGLAHHPTHVEAHHLLGMLYREAGETEKALDEWDIALRLDPGHTASRREMERLSPRPAEGQRDGAEAGDAPRGGVAPPGEEADAGLRTALSAALDAFARETRVRLSLLIDGSGEVLAQHGFARAVDVRAMASLAAGIHASSAALARMLGEPGFGQLHQAGAEGQIFLAPFAVPGGEMILVAVFGGDSSLGMVRVLSRTLTREIQDLPAWRGGRARTSAEGFERRLEAGVDDALRSS